MVLKTAAIISGNGLYLSLAVSAYIMHQTSIMTSSSRGDSSLQLSAIDTKILMYFIFHISLQRRSREVKSEEQGGQGVGTSLQIHRFGSFSSSSWRTFKH